MKVGRGRGLAASPIDTYGHFKSLDGLRALAIVVVMVFHLDEKEGLPGGFIGVDVFFVLSGFLITTLLVGEYDRYKTVRFGSFYMRRVLRLVPALGAVIVFAVIAVLVVPGLSHSFWRDETLRWLPATIFFVGNWPHAFDGHAQGLLGQTWSLAVEEQFYIVWPVLFIFFFSRFRREYASLMLTVVGSLLMLYAALELHNGWPLIRIYFGTDTHCSGLVIGCALALFMSSEWLQYLGGRRVLLQFSAVIAMALILYMVVVGSAADPISLALTIPLASIATAILILCQVTVPIPLMQSVLESAPARWVGKRSYGLYIWHAPIFMVLFTVPFVENHALTFGGLLCFAVSFVAAAASYRYIEQPVLRRWKAKYQRTEALPDGLAH